MRKVALILTLACIAFASVVYAQCRNGSCDCNATQSPQTGAPTGTNQGPDEEGWYWNVEGRRWWRYVDESGRPLEAKKAEKAERKPVVREQNFGVDRSKLDSSKPKILRRGREISQAQAFKLVEGKDLPNDASKLRLTVIGDEAGRRAVISDLITNPGLIPFADKLAVQTYDPSHWAVAGFKAGPGTTVYLQKPDGTVLHRQADYQDGADGLAKALRRADPNYDPTKDPDLRKPAPVPTPAPEPNKPSEPARPPFDLSKVPGLAWVAAAFGVLLLLKKEEK